MSANLNNLSTTERKRDIVSPDGERALALSILHGLILIVVALRKYLKIEKCEHCGR